jgi:hypothetical protein
MPALCTELSPSGHLVYRTNPSGPGGVNATDNRSGMVYLARRNLPCAAVDFTEANITGGWDLINISVKCRTLLLRRM